MVSVILALAVLGFCLWLLLTYVPMPAPVKTVIIALVVICLIVWVLDWAGFVDVGSLRRHPLR
jgi:hypothetical protein